MEKLGNIDNGEPVGHTKKLGYTDNGGAWETQITENMGDT